MVDQFPSENDEKVGFIKSHISDEIGYGIKTRYFIKGNTHTPLLEYVGDLYDRSNPDEDLAWKSKIKYYDTLAVKDSPYGMSHYFEFRNYLVDAGDQKYFHHYARYVNDAPHAKANCMMTSFLMGFQGSI